MILGFPACRYDDSRGTAASASMSDLGSHGSSRQFRTNVATFQSSLGCVRRNVTTPMRRSPASPGLVSSPTGAMIAGSVIADPVSISEPCPSRASGLTGKHSDSRKVHEDCWLSPLSETGISGIAVGARIVPEAACGEFRKCCNRKRIWLGVEDGSHG